ncbi:MAG TPA: ester cyclase [Thermomicrobiales bacterium]|nr:ester cyclase [Thermomicrobiales bacterium]
MSAEENAALARAINDAYNARDFDRAAELTAPDAEWVNVATGQTFRGPEGARQFLAGWAGAFPDSTVETTYALGGERGATLEFVGRGTQTGPLPSPAGDIPPTGRRVEVPFCQVLEIEGGKVRRARLYFDALGMMQQLGVIPAADAVS